MPSKTDDPARSATRVVIVCFFSLCIIFGIRLSFSVFFAEFVAAEGWSNEAAATVFSLNMFVFALTVPFAGLALDLLTAVGREIGDQSHGARIGVMPAANATIAKIQSV